MRTNKFREVYTYVLYGNTGVGKTHAAYEIFGVDNVYRLVMGDNQALWFDGYEGEPVLLLDEYYSQVCVFFLNLNLILITIRLNFNFF